MMLSQLAMEVPILQAPMAGVSTPAMAAAVSQAGGLGGISIGHVDLARARAMIVDTRERTQRAFNVNLFCHRPPQADAQIEAAWLEQLRPHFERYQAKPPARLEPAYAVPDAGVLALLLELRPSVVSFHFGLPDPAFVTALRQAGIWLLATATNLAEGLECERAGVQVVVAQGIEAGGHRGCFDPDAADEGLSTLTLLRILSSRIKLPLIAAGGLMDRAGVRAVLEAGALAAQLGTAYVASPESSAEAPHRQALLENPPATVMTRSISGRPARCLINRFTQIDSGTPPAYPIAYSAGKALHAAAKAQGESGYGAQWAGQGAPLARAVPAGQLTRELV